MDKVIFDHDFKLEDWMIHEDGKLELIEREIMRFMKVKVVVKSNERTHHNRPHVHAFFDEKEYSIAIDSSYDLLAPNKEDKYYKFIVRSILRDSLIQECREAWNNNTNSNIKFDIVDGIYQSTYHSA